MQSKFIKYIFPNLLFVSFFYFTPLATQAASISFSINSAPISSIAASTTASLLVTGVDTSFSSTTLVTFSCRDFSTTSDIIINNPTELIIPINVSATTSCWGYERNEANITIQDEATTSVALLPIINTTIPVHSCLVGDEELWCSIDDAVNNDANYGDTLLVYPGLYENDITIPVSANGVTLKSLAGAASTILVGSGNPSEPSAPYISSIITINASNVTIDGFTLQLPQSQNLLAYNAISSDPNGISNATIKNTIIKSLDYTFASGPSGQIYSFQTGLNMSQNSDLLIENTSIENCLTGLRVSGARPIIINSKIFNNRDYAVVNENIPFDASQRVLAANSFWGETGPNTGTTSLNALAGSIQYSPWCTNFECTASASLVIATTSNLFADPNQGNWLLKPPSDTPILPDGLPDLTSVTNVTASQQFDITLPTVSTSSEVGTTTISIPENTTISRFDGQPLDATQITAMTMNVSNVSGYTGDVIGTPIQWGQIGVSLVFSPAITIKLWVGTSSNGLILTVLHSTSTDADWNTDGIASSTCLVADGYCSFETTRASYFIATNPPVASSSDIITLQGANSPAIPQTFYATSNFSLQTTAQASTTLTITNTTTPLTKKLAGGNKISQQVLGLKIYPDGTLLKDRQNNKIYLIKSGKKNYIKNLKELAKHRGQRIYLVEKAQINSYK
ncbi:MAG: hypothetical protein WCG01_03435 [bacterium]